MVEGIVREQAIAAAEVDLRVQRLLRRMKTRHVTAEFSKRWNVSPVHFLASDRPPGFAAVNQPAKVLETGGPKEQ
jgi:hypothetical protein